MAFVCRDQHAYWHEIAKIINSSECVASTNEGFSHSQDIADCFSHHYGKIFNSVPYTEWRMGQLYHAICSCISGCDETTVM